MIAIPHPVRLRYCRAQSEVSAQLVEMDTTLAKMKVDPAWWSNLGISRTDRRNEGDHGWDWANRVGKFRNNLWVQCVAI